ncbi:GNAT family N-acetyltransferase [Brevibacillus choshinensis]|uniref:GNAT family N-acetyltransferase n=1 Tax=Brevibacillus choshinensis TaxID=54911 RepID=A0ABX7FKG7_BRECH|nr:GNAT family N-acetyltransferase [Brevibacillus choshinensis]QRG66721.1 GNAT family N-acetyltransferase [Brevibacillus choshinensis]
MELSISNESTPSDKAYVRQKMYEFNSAHFPAELKGRYQEVNLFVKDAEGQLFGGILTEIAWNWMEVHYLYVSEELRKAGYGSKLMAEAERIARENKCDFIKLDTLSFQALEFYRRLGFEVYGQIENAGGFTHYYLKKNL